MVDRSHEPHLDLTVSAHGEPFVIGQTAAVEPLAPHPLRVGGRGEDRHAREALERGDLGVVVVQVGEHDGVGPLPCGADRPLPAPAQDAVVAPHEGVSDDPHAVEIYDGRGVTEPCDDHAQRVVPLCLEPDIDRATQQRSCSGA
jgi:hypothetical protein